jgi:hypothetical protein
MVIGSEIVFFSESSFSSPTFKSHYVTTSLRSCQLGGLVGCIGVGDILEEGFSEALPRVSKEVK